MSKFTKLVEFNVQFQDDNVHITMERLKRKDLLRLAPLMPEADKDGTIKMDFDFADNLKLFEEVGGILPKYIKTFTGLKDDNGNALTFDDINHESYFMDLLSDIFTHLFEVSFVNKADEKNSGALLSSSLEDTPISTIPK